MVAAIYTRLSSDDGARNADTKSVTIQADDCRAFAAKNGWTVDDNHVYTDDGISGAVFGDGRPALARLLSNLDGNRPFDVLLVTEQSRIGRDAILTLSTILKIQNAGVRIFEARSGREITVNDAEGLGEIQEFIKAWGGAQERKKAGERVRPALRRRAEAGHVPGGKVFGYRNVEVKNGDGKRDYVTWQVIPEQAAVIRRIFEEVAAGRGFQAVARTLADEGAPSPRNHGWSLSGVRKVVLRETYRGRLVYGRTKLVPRRGQKALQVPVSETAWLVRDLPEELRIVSPALWDAAHARLARTRKTYAGKRRANGELHGRPESALVARHLLSGFLRCGLCGGNLFILNQKASAKAAPKLFYVCTTNYKRGAGRCANSARVPYNEITQAVIDRFSSRFLTPDVLRRFLEDDRAGSTPEAINAEREGLAADVRRLDGDIAKLVDAVTTGGDSIPALVEAMKAKQRARDNAAARIEVLAAKERDNDRFDFDAALEAGGRIVVDLEDLLARDPAEGRAVLRSLLTTPISVSPVETPEGRCFDFHADARLDGILSGRLSGGPTAASTVFSSPGSPCPRSGAQRPSCARGPGRGSCALPRDRGRRAAPSSP